MKFFLPLLIAFCLIAQKARSQCATDTLVNGGQSAGQFDTAQLAFPQYPPYPPCWHPECDDTACHAWLAPITPLDSIHNSWVGTIYLMATRPAWYNVQVWMNCRYITYDSCMFIQDDPLMGLTYLQYQFPYQSQVIVCGSVGDTVAVFPKMSHGVPYPLLDRPLVDMDTLCKLVSIAPELEGDGIYRELWPPYRETLEPQPGVLYMRNRKLVKVW